MPRSGGKNLLFIFLLAFTVKVQRIKAGRWPTQMMSNFTIIKHKWIEPHAKTTMHSTKVSRFCFLTAGREYVVICVSSFIAFYTAVLVNITHHCWFDITMFLRNRNRGPCWPFWPIASAQKYQETQNAIANNHIGGSKSQVALIFLGGNWGFHPVGTPHFSSYLIAILLPTPPFRTQVRPQNWCSMLAPEAPTRAIHSAIRATMGQSESTTFLL